MTDALDRLRRELADGLDRRREAGLLRRPELPAGVDLTSNDYLGYAPDPDLAARVGEAVARHGTGTGASRLLRGHTALVERLEERLADHARREAALLFPSGYQANVGLVPALVGRGDHVVSDALNHASLIDGIRLSKASRRIVDHADPHAFDEALAELPPDGRRLVVAESVFSMDGDLPDLEALAEVCARRDALLVVDEAHATGLFGPDGGGRVAELGLGDRVLATIHTGGKALGVGGAWVAGDRVLTEHLVNHARTFIYTTAPVPALPAALDAALDRRAVDQPLVDALHARASRLRGRLHDAGLDLAGSASPIVPVVLGGSDRTMAVAADLRARGWDVRGIRPPTVPEGTARLRVTVRAPLDDEQLDRFADDLLERTAARPAEPGR